MSSFKEYYNYYKSKGICTRCYKHKAEKGKVLCLQRLGDISQNSINYYKTLSEDKKKRNNEYIKRKNSLCVAFGVCVGCKQKDAKKGQLCISCWAKKNRSRVNKRMDIHRNEYSSYSRCYICGKESLEGYKVCSTHLESDRKNIGFARKSVDKESHIWKQDTNMLMSKHSH